MTTETTPELSPSGKYSLTVTYTGAAWQAHGLVQKNGETLAEVERNHSSFPFLWIEDHPNGHDYLVCSADYQGHTVIELDTGKRIDWLPPEAEGGAGHCMTDLSFNAEHKILIVEGCMWACPYEARLYDFADPMNGWPELESDQWMELGKVPIKFHEDGSFTVSVTEFDSGQDDVEWTERTWSVVETQLFRREGNKLVLASNWVDDAEKTKREKAAADRKKWQEDWDAYKASDPMFLRMLERVTAVEGFTEPTNVGVGITYKDWCPHYEGTDGRVSLRIAQKAGPRAVTMDLEWGRKEAPVLLSVYVGSEPRVQHWFEHSLNGMNLALDQAKKELT